jgi:hypothetical protein
MRCGSESSFEQNAGNGLPIINYFAKWLSRAQRLGDDDVVAVNFLRPRRRAAGQRR